MQMDHNSVKRWDFVDIKEFVDRLRTVHMNPSTKIVYRRQLHGGDTKHNPSVNKTVTCWEPSLRYVALVSDTFIRNEYCCILWTAHTRSDNYIMRLRYRIKQQVCRFRISYIISLTLKRTYKFNLEQIVQK
jgi:hypothetical protein